MIKELEKILNKDPIIHTKHAKEIIENPENVYNYYQLHAATHMPIGKTDSYYGQIFNWIVKNKGAAVGGVVGDYGLGKTSLLIYFWHKAQQDNILAIPPYSWDRLQDNFDVAYHWSKYSMSTLGTCNSTLLKELDTLYESYREKSINEEAETLSKHEDIPLEKAISIIQNNVDKGKFLLDNTEEDLLEFYEKLSIIAQKGKLDGLIVFTDELQQTVDSGKMSFKQMAGILFGLSNGLGGREGNYGMIFGMPLTFQARMSRERRDVLDRLRDQKCFVDLGEMYTQDFAEKLWETYVDFFDLSNMSEDIVDNSTLLSIGQISDSRRRDLGNGPRSVISAFNMMMAHYKEHNSSYRPTDFIKNCLDGEITLGDISTFVRRVNDILSHPSVSEDFKEIVLFLSAFPQGSTKDIEEVYNMTGAIADFIKDSGGLGKIISPSPGGGHIIKVLREEKIEEEESELKDHLSNFYNAFSTDRTHIIQAISTFIHESIPTLFPFRSPSEIIGWIPEADDWTDLDWGYETIFVGTFQDSTDYPFRRVKIQVVLPGEKPVPAPILTEEERSYNRRGKDLIDFLFRFNLNWDSSNISDPGKIEFQKWPSRIVTFHLNPFYAIEHKTILQVHDAIPYENCSAFLYLSLLDYMSETDIGSDEGQIWQVVRKDMESIIVNSLFNEDILDVQGVDIELDNKGSYAISDLFKFMCQTAFPCYKTIIKCRNWESKSDDYIHVLQNSAITLSVKRGREPLKIDQTDGSFDPKYSKGEIAKLFGLKGHANFDNWASDLGPLVDLNRFKDFGEISLLIHPIENRIVDAIESSTKTKEFQGKKCQYIDGRKDGLEALKLIIDEGYRSSEVELLISKIGIARKLFSQKDGYWYKLPQTIEEFKETVSKTVSDLQGYIDLLHQEIPEYEPSQMRDVFSRAKKVSDEEQYENVMQLLRQERIRIDQFILSQITGVTEKTKLALDSIKGEYDRQLGKISKTVSSKPESTASWIHSISEIQKILDKKHKDIKKEITSIERGWTDISEKGKQYSSKKGDKKIDEFIEIYKSLKDLEKHIDKEVKPAIQVFFNYVGHLEKWFEIARQYQVAFDKTTAIEQNLNQSDLKEEFQKAAKALETKLDDKKEDALKEFEIAEIEIQQIIDKANKSISSFRTTFNEQKASIMDMLKKADNAAHPIRTTFTEADISDSYKMLGDECQEIFKSILSEVKRSFAELSIDIEYSKKILDLDEEISKHKIAEEISEGTEEIEEVEKKIDPSLFTASRNKDEFSNLVECIVRNRDRYQKAHRDIRNIQSPSDVGNEAKKLLNLVFDGHPKNLKDIILEMTAGETVSLDEALERLKECFKSRQIEITVKRKR